MNAADSKRFAQTITALCAAFHKEADQATFRAYEIGLDDLPIEAIESAAGIAIKTSKFMPVPSELRLIAAAGGMDPDARALKAWNVFHANWNWAHDQDFDDPLVNATVRSLGGYGQLREVETAHWHRVRRDFLDVYKRYLSCPPTAEQCKPLTGQWMTRMIGGELEPIVNIRCGLPPVLQFARPGIAAQLPARPQVACDEAVGAQA